MNILLADDHALFRSGLKRIIMDEFPDLNLGEASSCQEVKEKMYAQFWNLLILDISMKNENSLLIMNELKKISPQTSIIVLSMYDEKQFIVEAFKFGAMAYLTKEKAPEELIEVMKKVMKGIRHVSESAAEHLAAYVNKKSTNLPHQSLSSREYEIFIHLASAKTVGEIARLLNISVKTVSTHRRHVLEKMERHSNSELMQYAVQYELIHQLW